MAESAKFWDRIAQRYSKKPVPDEAVYQKKLAVTREYLTPETTVLEIGCGTGSTAIAHAPYAKHVHATDISPKMLEIGRAKADAQAVGNVTFEQASVDSLRISEPVDVVLGLSILHLLESPPEAIAKVRQMLKPGGVFITSTACLGDKLKFFKIVGPIARFLRLMPLLKVFSRQELKNYLTDAGFAIEYEWQPEKSQAVFLVARNTAGQS